MSVETRNRLNPEQYLAAERANEYKSEYRGGDMIAMPGASLAHSRITVNLVYALEARLRNGPFLVLDSAVRIWVPATGLYTYADVTVLATEPIVTDKYSDTLINPTVLIEVLSPSTEDHDRGVKFHNYRQLESLREYLLVSQDRPRVEQHIRQETRNFWRLTEVTDLAASIAFPSLGCEIEMSEIYQLVPFDRKKSRSRRRRGE